MGYTFLLSGEVVSWCSKKQSCIALSTMDSEYVACLVATRGCLVACSVATRGCLIEEILSAPRGYDYCI